MSIYFSRFSLNTYSGTPYFRAQVPNNYPLSLMLQKCRSFRRLPPYLQQLARLARRWWIRKNPDHPSGMPDIESFYDEDGYELRPGTKIRLTDAEIDAQWKPDPIVDGLMIYDIQAPPGGFADPDTWEEPEKKDAEVEPPPTPEQIKRDISLRGRAAVEEEYGLEPYSSFQEGEDYEVTKARFAETNKRVLTSPFFIGNDYDYCLLLEALETAEIYEDLGGEVRDIYDRAEASL